MTCLLTTICDRTALLRTSLDRLSDLTPPDEILVVDDGGTDPALEGLCAQAGARYIYTHNPGNTQCSHARNVGIRAIDADYVITSEPEMRFETDVIVQLLAAAVEHPSEVISAGTVRHEQPNGTHEEIRGWVAPFVALYRREWLLAIGGWDESFPSPWGWDDTDLLTRLRVSGIGQFIDTRIIVTHQWHPSRACDQSANEAHFRAKDLERRDEHIVANRGRAWGVPLCR